MSVPDTLVQPLLEEATRLRRAGRPAEAETIYRGLLKARPADAAVRYLLATLLLLDGRFEEGLPLFESRFEALRLTLPPMAFPRWTGQPLDGKALLIWWDQGFGDQIQMARFAPILARTASRVTLLCEPALKRLFDSLDGVEVFARAGTVAFPDPDYWIPALSIPCALNLTPQTVPGAPYLSAPATTTPPGARFGIMTRGDPRNPNDANRSLPAEFTARLLELPGAISLHPDDTAARDFADTAALIAGLELVVAVDTAVAHLAGALGKPCWALIPAQGADWRWPPGRADTPWYPATRVFRQRPGEDWSRIVGEILEALA